MGISRRCASTWWHRYLEFGADGLHGRSSRPRRSPLRVLERVEQKICRQRRTEKLGPDRLAIHLGLPASTIYRVLVRHDLNRLSHMDRPTATPIRRYERTRPGELVHVDDKRTSWRWS
jgi:Homeodomain-like domain